MEFAAKFPVEFKRWHETSNSVIALSVEYEQALQELFLKLSFKQLKVIPFHEPDIGNELTCIAICPDHSVKKLLSGIPLAGKKTNKGAEDRLNLKFDLVEAMQWCEQTQGQTIWEHGQSVKDYFFDLVGFITNPSHVCQFDDWRFPEWFLSYGPRIVSVLPPVWELEKYTTWHDVGKPTCRTISDDGLVVQFPNHAKVSTELFRKTYPEQERVARLIERDMDIHKLSGEGVPEFVAKVGSLSDLAALLVAGVAEIHSNARLFGGTSSESFKIKWKHLSRRGMAICKVVFPESM